MKHEERRLGLAIHAKAAHLIQEKHAPQAIQNDTRILLLSIRFLNIVASKNSRPNIALGRAATNANLRRATIKHRSEPELPRRDNHHTVMMFHCWTLRIFIDSKRLDVIMPEECQTHPA
jgi:hypothetical protein